VVGWPLIETIRISFTDANLIAGAEHWVGLDNYSRALHSPDFLGALKTTVLFTVTTVSAELVIGVLVALLLNQPLRGRWFFRALLVLPWAMPTVINAMAWRLIYNPDFGALNALLTQVGIISEYRSWLGDPAIALWAVAVADIWKTFPLVAMITLAALQVVPQEQVEAAHIDGANAWKRFQVVTFPAILGPLLVAAVLRTIEVMKVFDIIYVMTKGGPANSTRTLSMQVYQEAFGSLRAGSGASQGLLVLLFTTILIVAYLQIVRRQARQ
jgi:multiple sugar transport system permease protein